MFFLTNWGDSSENPLREIIELTDEKYNTGNVVMDENYSIGNTISNIVITSLHSLW